MPPVCRLESRTTADAAHRLAEPSHQPEDKGQAGEQSHLFRACPSRERGKAPGGQGELRAEPCSSVGVGKLYKAAGGCLWGSSGLRSQISLVGLVLETAKLGSCPLGLSSPSHCGANCPRGLALGLGPQRLTVGSSVCWAAQQAEVPSL